jgi:trk system potassium uptake protein TrkA
MRIIIIGAGEVGFYLAKRLSFEKHDLTLIDSDPDKCLKAQEVLDIAVIEGHGASQKTLREAGIESADMVIAASAVDEVNIVACMVASKMGVKRKIARVRNPDYYSEHSILSPLDLGVDLFIHPEEEVTEEIVRLLLRATASEIVEFENGKILVVGLKIDAQFPFLNVQLKNMGTPELRKNFRVVAISRGDRTIIPKGEDYINKNDQVFVMTEAGNLPQLIEMAGKADEKLQKIMILGGGRIGLRVAAALEEMGRDVILIESDKEKSVEIAGQLRRAMVVQADATEIDVLAREGIITMDALVAVTGDDETNIISCLFAKHLGIKKTIARVNKVAYLPLMPVIGIDSTVNARLATAKAILRLVRRGDIVSIGMFHGIEAEAIEFDLSKENKFVGKPLRKLKMPEGSVVAAIARGKDVFVPVGDTIIQAGDRVIFFALPYAIAELERVLLK